MERFGNQNPQENTPPQIRIPVEDAGTHKREEKLLSAIPHDNIGIPEKMSPRERNEAFEKAYNAIVGNEKLEKLAVRGIKGEHGCHPECLNKMTELCVSLSDEQIENIIRKFNDKLRSKTELYTQKYKLNADEVTYLSKGMKMIGERRIDLLNPTGIKSVARFVRARMKLHSLEPSVVPAFYFENYFDAMHNIDLIEIFRQEEGVVMNLIQVKSREYTKEEIEKNTNAHREWVNGYAIDLEVYEKSFEVEPEDSERYKEFFANVAHVEDLIFDMVTSDDGMSVDILFERLGIKDKPNVERVWILFQYLEAIKEAFSHVEEVGLSEEQVSRIRGIIFDIESKLAVVASKKKDMTGVSEIHSICTVAEKVVSDRVIFKGEEGKRKAISIHE